MNNRPTREQKFFDKLVVEGSRTRGVLDRFSKGFYEKGQRGRLWTPFWQSANLAGSVVLDYGCGSGEFSQILARLGACVYGIDISPQLIGKARALTSHQNNRSDESSDRSRLPQFLICDAHQTPFDDSSFDYVFGNGTLHHLDLERAYGEIARVLKPGGKAVFMEPLYHHPLLWSLRRLTSRTHTADEKPLSVADMDKARRWFRGCSHREHFLFSVCAAPAHLFGYGFALSVIDRLDRFDQILMRANPRLRRFAWLSMLEMQK